MPMTSIHAPPRSFRARLSALLHQESFSGALLMFTALVAMLWANSPWAASYTALWGSQIGVRLGPWAVEQSLAFWINDGVMTFFFLAVGMEIRREMHQGALSDRRQAMLPVGAALGGVLAPALVYLALNHTPGTIEGWAVPTATDIAFAVGVLALLGRHWPPSVRIFLLSLAIIDDILAVLIIALFYSGGLEPLGFLLAGAGIVGVLWMQRGGVLSPWPYLVPGALVWLGILWAGAHPTLAGVVLGLMTPMQVRKPNAVRLTQLREQVSRWDQGEAPELPRLDRAHRAQQDLLPPAIRVQQRLHPWVAYLVMPLFALANAGVSLTEVPHGDAQVNGLMLGIVLALVVGKPIGIVLVTALFLRLGLGQMPPGMSWRAVWLVGLLAGIGFTMSIFIANLAFADAGLLAGAKLGVLVASVTAALLGLLWGRLARPRSA